MPDAHGHAKCAARIARRRLDPDLVERSFAEDASVAHAVQRHAACQAEIAHPRFTMGERRHLQHHLFGDFLDRPREVHFTLRQTALLLTRRSSQQPLHLRSRHGQPVRVSEELLIHPQAAIVFDLDDVVLDGLDVLRLAVRRESHHLVFARVHLEAREVGERRVQQAERMRELQLVDDLERIALADADRRCRPLADAVHGDDRGLLERRRIEGGRGVRFVMLAEQHLAFVALDLAADVVRHPQLLAEPERHRHQVRLPAQRRRCHVGLEEPRELDERLLIEPDVVDLRRRDAGFTQAVLDRLVRKRGVVLLAREALLLRGRDNAAVLDQAGRRVVVIRGDSEDAGWH